MVLGNRRVGVIKHGVYYNAFKNRIEIVDSFFCRRFRIRLGDYEYNTRCVPHEYLSDKIEKKHYVFLGELE
jgi:hypothetical protein